MSDPPLFTVNLEYESKIIFKNKNFQKFKMGRS